MRKLKIRVPGMKKKLSVHWIRQSKVAPLVVVVNGAFGHAKGSHANQMVRILAAQGILRDAKFPDEECGLFVLSMGKHGARELNYSSDVDLMVFYEPMKVDFRHEGGVQRGIIRMVQRLVAILQERTADGYVCRVDLRLRPDPGSTPVAVTYAAGITYYSSRGSTWERMAMIKARVAGGDIALGRRFLGELEPFIWRDHLDFWTLREISAIKRQINKQRGGGEIGFHGHNIKLGRGGIREIEFFAQTQQLIYAGRDSYLRCNRTVDALSTLAESGCIDDLAADELTESYEFLRQLEHRLQMVDDQQTQTLPADEDGMARVAGFMGYDNVSGFERDLRERLDRVEEHYATLFENSYEDDGGDGETFNFTTETPDPRMRELLESFGFQDVTGTYERLRRWRSGCFAATSEARGQALLDTLTPGVVEALGRTAWPDHGLERLDWFLAGLPGELRWLALLSTNPTVLELLIDILETAPALANRLRERPRYLETVLAPGFFAPLPDARFLLADGTETLRSARAADEAKRRISAWSSAHNFQVGVGVLRHTTESGESGTALANIADVALRCLHTWLVASDNRGNAETVAETVIIVLGAHGARVPVPFGPLELWLVHGDGEDTANAGRAGARAFRDLLSDPSDDEPLYVLRPEPRILSHAELRETLLENRDARSLFAACQARVVAGPAGLADVVSATCDGLAMSCWYATLRPPADKQHDQITHHHTASYVVGDGGVAPGFD